MKTTLLLSLAILGSCGSGGSGDQTTLVDEAFVDSSSILASGITADGNKEVSVNARLYASVSDLAVCEEALDGLLVYIKDEKAFYYCDGAILDWSLISLKGEDGEAGTAGVNGTNGTDGEAILQEGEWLNPLDSKKYVLFSTGLNEFDCPEGTDKPSLDGTDYSQGVIKSSEISGAYWRYKENFVYDSGTISGTSDDGKKYVSFVTNDGYDWVVEDSDGNFTGKSYPKNGPIICKIQ